LVPVFGAESHPFWQIDGTRGGRAVGIELDQHSGHVRVWCSLRLISDRFDILGGTADGTAFQLSEELMILSPTDPSAMWQLLPELARKEILDVLDPAWPSFSVASGRATLRRTALLPELDAVARIVHYLDRLLAIAAVLEQHWDPPPPPPPPPSLDHRDVAARAVGALDRMLARFHTEVIAAFPAADPLTESQAVVGRVVLLPPRAPSQWVMDFDIRVLHAGDVEQGWYFARANRPGFARVLRAAARYERATGSTLGDTPYRMIARITGPVIFPLDDRMNYGLAIDILGAAIGDRVFIDASTVVGDESLFEGEAS
jgi:hypothetical protein